MSDAPQQGICGFCGQMSDRVVEGPNGVYACWNCLLSAREVLTSLQQTYTCSFCLETAPGNSMVEGPNNVHMCAACVESGIKLLNK